MNTEELEGEGGSAVSIGEEPEPEPGPGEAAAEEAARRLEIAVDISDAGPCKKHLRVSIPRAEIDRQFEESLESLRKDASVPGFRPGRAPRQLVVKRFKKQVAEQVKTSLLASSLQQIDSEYHLEPITQPRLDIAAIELPDEGPMNFEMDVEVRPQFELPNYRGLALKRPVKDITEADIQTQLQRYLERHGQIVPKLQQAAELDDYLTDDLVFLRPNGTILNEAKEIQFRLQPELRFQDGAIPNLGAVLTGVQPGETRQVEAKLGTAVADPDLRGKTIPVRVHVHDLKQVRLPEINPAFLNSIGFESLNELREAVHEALKRRVQTQQRLALRRQILDELLRQTPFELPADLVAREESNTIRRLVMELRQEGMSDNEIRAREAEIRANAHESTLRSLKELLLLAKIADAEQVKVEEDDLTVEIESIAERTNESPRRIRARLEKEGMGDNLATQILERKVIDRILAHSTIEDVVVATEEPEARVETLDQTAAAEVAPPTSTQAAAEEPGT